MLLYPREVVLVPEARLNVLSEDGEIPENIEVSRTWNHYLGDGWKSSVTMPDESGEVRFPAVKKRVPVSLQLLKLALSPFGHYYPGLAGSFKARDPNNHSTWERIDFNDSNCCPAEIRISNRSGDALESTFTFGDIVPNE